MYNNQNWCLPIYPFTHSIRLHTEWGKKSEFGFKHFFYCDSLWFNRSVFWTHTHTPSVIERERDSKTGKVCQKIHFDEWWNWFSTLRLCLWTLARDHEELTVLSMLKFEYDLYQCLFFNNNSCQHHFPILQNKNRNTYNKFVCLWTLLTIIEQFMWKKNWTWNSLCNRMVLWFQLFPIQGRTIAIGTSDWRNSEIMPSVSADAVATCEFKVMSKNTVRCSILNQIINKCLKLLHTPSFKLLASSAIAERRNSSTEKFLSKPSPECWTIT